MRGTVSEGTLRIQDLIPKFIETLREVNPVGYAQCVVNNALIPAYVEENGDDCEWWASDNASWMLIWLTEALEEEAEEGYYFGAHHGDGACIGYWEIMEA